MGAGPYAAFFTSIFLVAVRAASVLAMAIFTHLCHFAVRERPK